MPDALTDRRSLIKPMSRVIAALIVLLVLALYYADGLRYQVWPDSIGYVDQAIGIAGFGHYGRPIARSTGYPVLIAAALRTPFPMLLLVLFQIAATVAALVALFQALRRWALPELFCNAEHQLRAQGVLLVFTTAAALYSVIHVQAMSVLTETLFSTLAFAGVLATIWFLRQPATAPKLLGRACVAAAVISLNLWVKPHWLFVASVLLVTIIFHLGRAAWPYQPTSRKQWAQWMLTLCVPAIVCGAIFLPDRLLSARYDTPAGSTFGPRTVFCNHLHLIDDALSRRPALRLQDDPQFETKLRAHMKDLRARHVSGWKRLGFDGDLCTYDRMLTRSLNTRFPDLAAQSTFLTGALRETVLAEPLPYLRKVAKQLVLGVTSSFEKYAQFGTPGEGAHRTLLSNMPRDIERGIAHAPVIGPFDNEARYKKSLTGKLIQMFLALTFFSMTGVLCACFVGAPVLAWRGWRNWGTERRSAFVIHLVVPIAAVMAHHLLVALVHTFDVWRYAFNMFYVSLYIVAAGTLLLVSEYANRSKT